MGSLFVSGDVWGADFCVQLGWPEWAVCSGLEVQRGDGVGGQDWWANVTFLFSEQVDENTID